MAPVNGIDGVAPATRRLAVTGITKRFSGSLALSEVALEIGRGETVGLVGENGAGKSTLLNILSGVLKPDAGTIELDGAPVNLHSYLDANSRGVFRVFQDPALVSNLPVFQAVFLGHEHLFRTRGIPGGRRQQRAAAREALGEFGLEHIDVNTEVGDLSLGMRQGVEIARAISLAKLLEVEHPLILLDEPTSALDQEHEQRFLEIARELHGQAALLFVSHLLPEVLGTCDRVVVLKDGLVVDEAPTVQRDEGALHQAMVGRLRTDEYFRESRQVPLPEGRAGRLELAGAQLPSWRRCAPIDLQIGAGEILGIAGIEGCGRHELGAAVGGDITLSGGMITVDGKPVGRGARGAVAAGIAYVPRNRTEEGLIMDASVADNIALGSVHDRLSAPFGFIRSRQAIKVAEEFRDRLEIRLPAGVKAPVRTLSGGNQQKVLLAKWLFREPRVLVLDSPTQGVDTGAREAVYDIVRDASDDGIAVLLISDDLPELIGLSHRIAVMAEGRVVDIVNAPTGAKPTEEYLVDQMLFHTTMEVLA
jgi:ribose transport system ATP-binding protein